MPSAIDTSTCPMTNVSLAALSAKDGTSESLSSHDIPQETGAALARVSTLPGLGVVAGKDSV